MALRTLTDLELRMIDYAATNPVYTRQHIIEEFGWRTPVFLSRLFALLEDPAAARERPMEVRRLRDLRDQRRAARTATFASRAG